MVLEGLVILQVIYVRLVVLVCLLGLCVRAGARKVLVTCQTLVVQRCHTVVFWGKTGRYIFHKVERMRDEKLAKGADAKKEGNRRRKTDAMGGLH